MTEKLELKHLSPYLPYGLKLFYTHTKKIGQVSNIYTIGEGYDNDDIKISIDYTDGEHIWMYKPILRPLSDLTEEIEEGKPMFFPSHQLIKHIEQQQDIFNCSYSEIDYLIRNHFDVFGLIEKGLAIDINKI
jgi:hypothetical protein